MTDREKIPDRSKTLLNDLPNDLSSDFLNDLPNDFLNHISNDRRTIIVPTIIKRSFN